MSPKTPHPFARPAPPRWSWIRGACQACRAALGPRHQVFALHVHQLLYAGDPRAEWPSRLVVHHAETFAHYCSSACSKPNLGPWLASVGLPIALQDKSIEDGPVHPCACCGKPVDRTMPHGTWVRASQATIREDDIDPLDPDSTPNPGLAPAWLDVLAVTCLPCAGLEVEVDGTADAACRAAGTATAAVGAPNPAIADPVRTAGQPVG